MKRPMPGPPECLPTGFPHEGAAINAPGCLLHARSYHANSKRLKDDECADEFWSVWRNILRYDDGDPDRGEAIQQANTWLRFATHPHALEEA